MSIGTLLAYTLVDACVLILRYQQRSQPTFIELIQSKEVTFCYICLLPVKPEVHQLTSCQTESSLKTENI